MHVRTQPSTLEKLIQIADATEFEPAGDQPEQERRERYQSHSLAECISNVSTPRGKMPVLKSMMTTACERNCYYCPFRAGRSKTKRVRFTPDEMAGALDELSRAGQVDGMFLSSGIIKGGVTTQDKIIDTAEIVRRKYHYKGYVHLKIMPGSEYDQLYRAMQLADRISVNLEAPTQARLEALAPKKEFTRELLDMLMLAAQIRREHPHEKLAGSVTQFVVGAVGDTDLELLSLSGQLYRQAGLKRVYYSGFHPITQTPLENVAPTDPLREHRLYQASFLLRDYAWEVEELPFVGEGNLRLDLDPKRAWAEVNLAETPIDLMTADREQLMRVPGIGPKTADAIIRARRQRKLIDIGQLGKLMRAPEQTAPYILLDGQRPAQQLRLF
ncbi:MAG: helix-hairpin-helix domain-containing protein [Anaerolineae bacterium]|nr:helix-hairpin-helix domain-containing protein [Anaerolineae bacterium]